MDEYLDTQAACAFLGGNRPIHPSTLWRWVKARRIRPPIGVGPNTVRFKRSVLAEDLATIERASADRDGTEAA